MIELMVMVNELANSEEEKEVTREVSGVKLFA